MTKAKELMGVFESDAWKQMGKSIKLKDLLNNFKDGRHSSLTVGADAKSIFIRGMDQKSGESIDITIPISAAKIDFGESMVVSESKPSFLDISDKEVTVTLPELLNLLSLCENMSYFEVTGFNSQSDNRRTDLDKAAKAHAIVSFNRMGNKMLLAADSLKMNRLPKGYIVKPLKSLDDFDEGSNHDKS